MEPGALSYDNVVAACEASLRRLGTRPHRPVPAAPSRPDHADRGDPARARRSRRARAGARHRHQQLPGVGDRRPRWRASARSADPRSPPRSSTTRWSVARPSTSSSPSAGPTTSASSCGARCRAATSPVATGAEATSRGEGAAAPRSRSRRSIPTSAPAGSPRSPAVADDPRRLDGAGRAGVGARAARDHVRDRRGQQPRAARRQPRRRRPRPHRRTSSPRSTPPTALAPIYPAWWDPAMGIPAPNETASRLREEQHERVDQPRRPAGRRQGAVRAHHDHAGAAGHRRLHRRRGHRVRVRRDVAPGCADAPRPAVDHPRVRRGRRCAHPHGDAHLRRVEQRRRHQRGDRRVPAVLRRPRWAGPRARR